MSSNTPRRLVVLGSTGSIGRQALEVARMHPHLLQVVGLGTGRDEQTLKRQAAELGVEHIGLGVDDAIGLATLGEADIVLNAIVGAAGLRASVAALEAGKTLALANKESLVAGGEICLATAARTGARIVPVDSEHAALAQCLQGTPRDAVARLCLTASGGPFRARADLSGVTKEEALAHPTWSMGPKITVDCATLMNKGLEVIEAHFLFGVAYDAIDVVVHPQSVVHGMVVLADGSVLLQAAVADMRLPIQAAVLGTQAITGATRPPDLTEIARLDFEPVDHGRFPALRLAYDAGRAGRTRPAVLNAANEEAVRGFLDDRIGLSDITAVVEATLEAHDPAPAGNLDTVLEVDGWARGHARALIESGPGRPTRSAPAAERILGRST